MLKQKSKRLKNKPKRIFKNGEKKINSAKLPQEQTLEGRNRCPQVSIPNVPKQRISKL